MKENVETLNAQAIDLASKGLYEESIACYKTALKMDGENIFLWYNLGVTYRNAGKFNLAKEAFLYASKIDEDNKDVLSSLGLVYFELKEYDLSYKYYMSSLALFSEDAQVWNNLGVLLFEQALYDDASEAFEMAVTIDPHYYDAMYNLRDTYRELSNKTGEEICNQCLKALQPPAK